MNVQIDIPIHKESENYIKETLGQYKEVSEMDTISNPIIHMYAKEDTRDLETGELNGYADSLFCEYHFYNTKNMTVFKSKNHDALQFGIDVSPETVKIFKDGSTLVHLYGNYELYYGTAVIIENEGWLKGLE